MEKYAIHKNYKRKESASKKIDWDNLQVDDAFHIPNEDLTPNTKSNLYRLAEYRGMRISVKSGKEGLTVVRID